MSSLTTGGLPAVPTNQTTVPDVTIAGSGSKAGQTFAMGNYDISLAVDPVNPNVVYLGGTDEFQVTGLVRIDTTGIRDSHSFYVDSTSPSGGLYANSGGAVTLKFPTNGPYTTNPPSLDPISSPELNLIRDPNDPFRNGATVLVHNVLTVNDAGSGFVNDGGHTSWIQFDRALAPNPYASATDPWSVPTRGVHQIVTTIDPLTGGSRLLFATDQGIYTSVSDKNGALIGSIGRTTTPLTQSGVPSAAITDTSRGDQVIVNGSRNGNLAIAQVYQGAAQPSQLAAALSLQRGFFYGNTQDVGLFQSDPNILNKGSAGYGNLSANVDTINGANQWTIGNGGTIDRGTGVGLATQQNFSPTDGGTLYAYRVSEDSVGIDGPSGIGRNSTDTVRVNTVGKTFRLYQTSSGGNTPDAQWPFRQGYNLTVNPLSGDQMLISSQNGRVFATTTRGDV